MMRRLILATIVAAAGSPASAMAEDALTLYFHERAPYSIQNADGSVHGITADIATKALDAAGIGFHWEDLPSARQLETIKRGDGPACGLGWFKRPDREAFARFTVPIYRDLPTIVVGRAGDARLAGSPRLDALFAAKALTLLVKTGYSYGGEIDAKIAALAPRALSDAGENRTMLAMIDGKRADYMIMAEEEAADLLRDPAFSGLAVYYLQDPPPGEYRYLMCSQVVPEATIAKIDGALPKQP